MELSTQEAKVIIDAACEMYSTAATLAHRGMTDDANSVSKKARLLLNQGLVRLGISPPDIQQ